MRTIITPLVIIIMITQRKDDMYDYLHFLVAKYIQRFKNMTHRLTESLSWALFSVSCRFCNISKISL